jgi:nucleoside-diphosphate-sugar epimerase
VVDGDFSQDLPELPGDLDVVIHCAATVSFDPPIDEGFQTNLFGAVRLYEAVLAANAAPHLLHVSTAYVAGVRKGVIPEATLDHRVDWQAESDLAIGARADVEPRAASEIRRFLRKARSSTDA